MQESIFHGGLPQRLSGNNVGDTPPGSLDTGRESYLTSYPQWRADLEVIGITKGAAYAAMPGMWVKDFKISPVGDRAEVDISLEGILDGNGDKRQRRISAFGSIVSIGPIQDTQIILEEQNDVDGDEVRRRVPKVNSTGDPVYVTINVPGGSGLRWNINDAGITVIDTYFTTSPPDMSEVTTALTPPSAPAPPAYLWGSYGGELRKNFPSGWVLSNREPEQLYGSILGGQGLWKITDTSDYFFPAVPD